MRRVILTITSTVAALVLLLSYKTHSPRAVASPPVAAVAAAAAAAPVPSTSASPSTAASAASAASAAKSAVSTAARTVTGTAADTRYGPVQVSVTISGGKVTAVQAVDYPQNDPRDAQINAYAIPVLNSEAVAAGSASIDMVSGATYTSTGYLQSLQSALDSAGL